MYRRLERQPAATSDVEAYKLLCQVINETEDEITGIPYDPSAWMTDGRIYPPLPDSERRSGISGVRRFVTKGHEALIGSKGGILIRQKHTGEVEFSKAGADGKTIEL